MAYVILDSQFEGETFESESEVATAIETAINDGDLAISDAEDLELMELVPVSLHVTVSVDVSIG